MIVVNCIILGRAESYASKNPVLSSIFDGLGDGLGFTVSLVAHWSCKRSLVPERLSEHRSFRLLMQLPVLPTIPRSLSSILAPGAFSGSCGLAAIQNKVRDQHGKEGQRCFQDPVRLWLQLCDLRRMSFRQRIKNRKWQAMLLIAIGSALLLVVLSQFLGIYFFPWSFRKRNLSAWWCSCVLFIFLHLLLGLLYKFILFDHLSI